MAYDVDLYVNAEPFFSSNNQRFSVSVKTTDGWQTHHSSFAMTKLLNAEWSLSAQDWSYVFTINDKKELVTYSFIINKTGRGCNQLSANINNNGYVSNKGELYELTYLVSKSHYISEKSPSPMQLCTSDEKIILELRPPAYGVILINFYTQLSSSYGYAHVKQSLTIPIFRTVDFSPEWSKELIDLYQ